MPLQEFKFLQTVQIFGYFISYSLLLATENRLTWGKI